jgi:hypothetical protein
MGGKHEEHEGHEDGTKDTKANGFFVIFVSPS